MQAIFDSQIIEIVIANEKIMNVGFKKNGMNPVIIKKLYSNQEDEINLIKLSYVRIKLIILVK